MKRTVLTAIIATMISASHAEVYVTTREASHPNNMTVTVSNNPIPEDLQLHPAVDVLALDYKKINPDNPKLEKIEIEVPFHGRFSYSAPVANSEGDWWECRFKSGEFKGETSMAYKDLEKLKTGAPGSDDAVKTETFEALKKGKHKIEIVHVHRS